MNIQKLKGHIPQTVLDQLPDTITKFNINTTLRLSHFLSQCAHESSNFRITKENLNYSAPGLLKTFPTHFTVVQAKNCEHNPEKVGNQAYASRNGNGDVQSGDGYRYCGRGYIQLTGKINYKAFDKLVEEDILALPGLVGSKYPLMSAGFFFNNNNLWSVCDSPLVDKGGKDLAEKAVAAVTKRVNGGLNGFPERLKYFKLFYNLLKE